MQAKNIRSWLELGLFTGFLFLLVAIPYTIYLKASTPTSTPVILTNLQPTPIATPSPLVPSVSTPSATANTVCVPVAPSYQATNATPAAYLFPSSPRKLCYPPELPPYPFTWATYKDYQHSFSIDIPTDWVNKTASVKGTVVHIYAADQTASASATPTVSFAFYPGQDPLATDTAYLKQTVTKDGVRGTIYTRYSSIVSAIFAIDNGFLLLQAGTDDKGFYAFEHMLDSLRFRK